MCFWPDPDNHRTIENCENGAKAVADEGTTREQMKNFEINILLKKYRKKSDYWLNSQGEINRSCEF